MAFFCPKSLVHKAYNKLESVFYVGLFLCLIMVTYETKGYTHFTNLDIVPCMLCKLCAMLYILYIQYLYTL